MVCLLILTVIQRVPSACCLYIVLVHQPQIHWYIPNIILAKVVNFTVKIPESLNQEEESHSLSVLVKLPGRVYLVNLKYYGSVNYSLFTFFFIGWQAQFTFYYQRHSSE